MKKIFSVLALIIIGALNCQAQVIHTADFVKIELPNGVYKLSKQQVNAIAPGFKLPGRPSTAPIPTFYQMDNVRLGIYNVIANPPYGDLVRLQSYNQDAYKFLRLSGNNSFNSVIKIFGTNQALITNYNLDGIGYYWFFYRNEAKSLGMGGKMEYDIADQAKAEALLNDVLNNIQFTK